MIHRSDAVVTTAGDRFTGADHMVLAALIYDRFGRDIKVGAEKWRQMLGNDTTPDEFRQLVHDGTLLSRVPRKLWNEST